MGIKIRDHPIKNNLGINTKRLRPENYEEHNYIPGGMIPLLDQPEHPSATPNIAIYLEQPIPQNYHDLIRRVHAKLIQNPQLDRYQQIALTTLNQRLTMQRFYESHDLLTPKSTQIAHVVWNQQLIAMHVSPDLEELLKKIPTSDVQDKPEGFDDFGRSNRCYGAVLHSHCSYHDAAGHVLKLMTAERGGQLDDITPDKVREFVANHVLFTAYEVSDVPVVFKQAIWMMEEDILLQLYNERGLLDDFKKLKQEIFRQNNKVTALTEAELAFDLTSKVLDIISARHGFTRLALRQSGDKGIRLISSDPGLSLPASQMGLGSLFTKIHKDPLKLSNLGFLFGYRTPTHPGFCDLSNTRNSTYQMTPVEEIANYILQDLKVSAEEAVITINLIRKFLIEVDVNPDNYLENRFVISSKSHNSIHDQESYLAYTLLTRNNKSIEKFFGVSIPKELLDPLWEAVLRVNQHIPATFLATDGAYNNPVGVRQFISGRHTVFQGDTNSQFLRRKLVDRLVDEIMALVESQRK
jgi:hypothetical protein